MKFILANITAFVATLLKYGITSHLRIAHFLAQISEETGGFIRFYENLNYTTTSRLLQIFSKYFNSSNVNSYVGKPQAIANRVYANRLGNGNEASGDGWKYRGRGLMQLTGKSNYQAYKLYSGVDIVTYPDLAARIDIALDIAGWYWHKTNCNSAADANDIEAVTKKVNGGLINLDARKKHFAIYNKENLTDLLKKKV
jgi:putative chitinase